MKYMFYEISYVELNLRIMSLMKIGYATIFIKQMLNTFAKYCSTPARGSLRCKHTLNLQTDFHHGVLFLCANYTNNVITRQHPSVKICFNDGFHFICRVFLPMHSPRTTHTELLYHFLSHCYFARST